MLGAQDESESNTPANRLLQERFGIERARLAEETAKANRLKKRLPMSAPPGSGFGISGALGPRVQGSEGSEGSGVKGQRVQRGQGSGVWGPRFKGHGARVRRQASGRQHIRVCEACYAGEGHLSSSLGLRVY